MSNKKNGIKWSKQPQKKVRRYNVLQRLKNQLELGVKNTKEGPTKLEDKDISRIKKEILILQERI